VDRDDERTDYAYRPDGLRHQKTSEGVTTLHLWDGQDIVAEYTENGSRKARYMRGVGLLSQRVDEGEFFYLHNAHGDVVQRTDFSGGIAKTYDYDAFGVEQGIDQTDPNPFRY